MSSASFSDHYKYQKLESFTPQALSPVKFKGRHLLIFLLISGQVSLWEVTNRINFIGGLSADGLRNIMLLFIALIGAVLFATQRSGQSAKCVAYLALYTIRHLG